jgi:hypothetical protein
MNINLLVVGLMAAALALHITHAFLHADKPPSELPWVPIQVGKTRAFHSQTRDAGLYTEATRRKAIIGNPTLVPSYKGSTNGSLEWNFLTGICVCPPRGGPPCPAEPGSVIWDANGAEPEICDVVDAGGAFGGYETVDFGGAADGNVCEV